MTAITIDTYKVAKKLTEKGYTKAQAEGFIAAIEEIKFDEVASKQDLRELELRLTIKIGGAAFLLAGYLTAIKFFA